LHENPQYPYHNVAATIAGDRVQVIVRLAQIFVTR